MIAGPLSSPTLVGRSEELGTLLGLGRDASGGAGSLVLVEGEPGLGKTRLVEEARAALEREGIRSAVGACHEFALAPLGPLVDALRRLDPDLPARVTAGSDRFAQYAEVRDALARATEAGPLVLALEDVHWSDVASLEALSALAPEVRRMPLVVVLTFRATDALANADRGAMLGRLQRAPGAWRIELRPLSDGDIGALVDGIPEARALPAAVRALVVERAEGNPLFAEELVKTALDDAHDGGPPASVRRLVLDRLRGLAAPQHRVLGAAALLGRPLTPDRLATFAGVGVDVAGAAAHAGLRAGLLVRIAGAPAVAFRHALLREVLAEELPPLERTELHARIAQVLASEPGAAAAEIAHHYRSSGDEAHARPWDLAAGREAVAACAFADAVAHFERGCVLDDVDGDERFALAAAYTRALRLSTVDGVRAYEVGRALLEHPAVARVPLRVEFVCAQLAGSSEYAGRYPEMYRWSRRALEAVGDDDVTREARSSSLTFVEFYAMYAEGTEDGDDAASFLRGLQRGERPDSATAAYLDAMRAAQRGDGVALDARVRDGLRVARNSTSRLASVTIALLGAFYSAHLGRRDRAEGYLAEAIDAVDRVGTDRYRWLTVTCRAYVAATFGAFEEAVAHVRELAPSGLQFENINRTIFFGVLLRLAARTGDDTLVEELPHEWRDGRRLPSTPWSRADIAEYALATGAPEGAAALRRYLDSTRRIGWEPWAAVLAAARGDEADIPRVQAMLDAWHGPENPAAPAYRALVDAYAARRNGEAATATAERAVALLHDAGLRYHEALALELAGRTADAAALHKHLGSLRDAARLEPPSDRRNRRGRAPNELTARERDIAALVARGRRNREIATALVLSERTVETHVAAILAKLGAATRAELVARFGERLRAGS